MSFQGLCAPDELLSHFGHDSSTIRSLAGNAFNTSCYQAAFIGWLAATGMLVSKRRLATITDDTPEAAHPDMQPTGIGFELESDAGSDESLDWETLAVPAVLPTLA